jgi:sarcosine oxidase delta subunit
MKEFVHVYCNENNKSKMRLNNHHMKGCHKFVDEECQMLKLKLYLPLKSVHESKLVGEGKNLFEY